MASLMNDSEDNLLFFRSKFRRRHRVSPSNVRSTVQRIGSFTQPLVPSGRRTISISHFCVQLDPFKQGKIVIFVVGEHPLDLAHGLAFQPGEQLACGLRLVEVRRGYQVGQKQAHAVHDDLTLQPTDVLGVVAAPMFTAGGGVQRMAVSDSRGARVVGLRGRADLAAKLVVDRVQGAVASTSVEVPPNGTLGRKVTGQVTPMAAGAEDEKDSVDNIAHLGGSGTPYGRGGREVGLNQSPSLVGEVARVVVGCHTTSAKLDPQLCPLVRQESLGEEEAKAETFRRNPAGNQPPPVELASGRKRVLHGAGATWAAKRRQRVSGSCD